jgi:soluble lytic murein transglycosylase
MRQESLFRADAVSVANARGLLQMLPATARATAKQSKMPVPSDEELFNPRINVPLATVHLKSLVDNFDGQILLALAAYNAGSTAVRRWLPVQVMDSDIWMENIPYNETRNYVQRILWHSLVFHWLRTQEPLDTKAWLAPISPVVQ